MSSNKIYRLWFKSNIALSQKNYEKVIKNINKYFEIPCAGVTAEILDMYIFANIKLNNFEVALKYIEIINKDYFEYYDKATLAMRYIQCYEIEKARKIIYNEKLSDKEYYTLGKQLILCKELDLARYSFNKCINITDKDWLKQKCKNELGKISKHIYEDCFLEEDYYNFKQRGEKLEKGHIIYAKVDDEEYIQNDPKYNDRPYLIWKIEDDKIYCFPVAKYKQTKSMGYVVYHQKYLNFDSDRRIKDHIVTIKESDIEKVYEKLSDKDLACVLTDNYHNMYLQDEETRNKKQEYINDYIKNANIKKGDVAMVIDQDAKRRYYFYILDILEDGYKVVQVNNKTKYDKFDVVSDRIVFIPKKSSVYTIIKLQEEEKSRINFISLNKINLKLNPGFLMRLKEKLQIVFVENNNIYICRDEVFDSSTSLENSEKVIKLSR